MEKNTYIMTRIDHELLEQIQRLADADKRKRADYIRLTVLDAIEANVPFTPMLYAGGADSLMIRVTPEERDAVRLWAESHGTTVSEGIRSILERHVDQRR